MKAFRPRQLVLATLLILQMVQYLLETGEYSRRMDTLPMQALHIMPQTQDPPAFNSTTANLFNKLSLSGALPAFEDFLAYRGVRPPSQNSSLNCDMHKCFNFERYRYGFTVYIYPDDPDMKNPTGRDGHGAHIAS